MPDAINSGGSSLFTVLVADDNDVAQRLCKRVLEKAGYSVLIAADGLQAVDIAFSQHPSMILMDVAMPGIDGLEAMRRIKAEMPAMPIVMQKKKRSIGLLGLAVNTEFNYPNYFAMIPSGPEPKTSFTKTAPSGKRPALRKASIVPGDAYTTCISFEPRPLSAAIAQLPNDWYSVR